MARRKHTVDYNQAGYAGDAMSIGAVQAYREGAMPISRWTKAALTERIVDMGGARLCGLYTVKELHQGASVSPTRNIYTRMTNMGVRSGS